MLDRYVPVVLMVVFAHYFACYCAADEAAGEVADTVYICLLKIVFTITSLLGGWFAE